MDGRGPRLGGALRPGARRGGLSRLERAEEEGEVLPRAADPFLAVELCFFSCMRVCRRDSEREMVDTRGGGAVEREDERKREREREREIGREEREEKKKKLTRPNGLE